MKTAFNRMYYACYYAATAKLISMGIEVKSHDGVRLNLGKHVVMARHLSPEFVRLQSTDAGVQRGFAVRQEDGTGLYH